ncbi:chalcone-flavanone isomerase-domain-containing protein [Collybia nuda]|uniref:Chalcone-flavanone isomerase-domain-containing protein n=1 Tax=Collybia nuda TaxID=64659 RepID=A0A9P5Y143_9AGAR|nr:chalcone-flavanone isomerase-domain-containing protein [Collybia nuda]
MSFLPPLLARTARVRVPIRYGLRLSSSSVPYALPTSKVKPLSRLSMWGAAALVACVGTTFVFGPTIHLDSLIQVEDHDIETITDRETSIEFPTIINIPSKTKVPSMTLLGVGVRRVSVLKVKVYSIGFYADLNNPNLKVPLEMPPEEKIAHIIQNSDCVVRIVPTRTTSYTHLRDAFMRALQARMGLAKQNNTLSEEGAQAVGSPMRKLKTLFPNTPIIKHTPLDIYIPAPIPGRSRPLIFRDLGAIESDWVATQFALHYIEGGTSPPLTQMVREKLALFKTCG